MSWTKLGEVNIGSSVQEVAFTNFGTGNQYDYLRLFALVDVDATDLSYRIAGQSMSYGGVQAGSFGRSYVQNYPSTSVSQTFNDTRYHSFTNGDYSVGVDIQINTEYGSSRDPKPQAEAMAAGGNQVNRSWLSNIGSVASSSVSVNDVRLRASGGNAILTSGIVSLYGWDDEA